MLNNLTNFFNLIQGRRIKKTLEKTDLIPLGTYDPSFGGGYKPTAIQAKDLLNNLTVTADGNTIIGDGSVDNPLIAVVSGAPVTYSRVCFVDAINGVDATGAINIFDKPFLTIPAARTAATALIGISVDNRALVYIRRGQYNNAVLTLTNNVDFYCEPGVVFTGIVQIRDNGVAVNSNVYGSLKINSGGTTIPLVITGASTITFEFDSIISNAAAFEINCASTLNRVRIKGNRIYSNTLGQGFGSTIRGASNVILSITNSMEAIHSVIDVRNFTGRMTINCTKIILAPGNIYGGNFKHCIHVVNAGTNGLLEINGDIICEDTLHYGGTSALIRYWSSPNLRLIMNGNVFAENDNAIVMTNGAGTLTYSGIIKTNRTALFLGTSSRANIKNTTIIRIGDIATGPIGINNSSTLYINDTTIYSAFPDGNIINIESNTASLYIKDVTAEGVGFNYFVNTGTATPITGLVNAYSTKPNSPGFVNAYSIAGSFIQDASINVPKF
jgi:hypothetical protein